MSWESILKRELKEWAALGEVIFGSFTHEYWSNKKIPDDLKTIKEKFDKASSSEKKAIQELIDAGMRAPDDSHRVAFFKLIITILE
tara:strand:- start:5581 stop:5838 length:258 start_codon:yes stop_codon:yes gene_type:complete